MIEWYPRRQLVTIGLGMLVLMTGLVTWVALLYLVTLAGTALVRGRQEEAAWAEPSSPSP
jgi:hypothetical protein